MGRIATEMPFITFGEFYQLIFLYAVILHCLKNNPFLLTLALQYASSLALLLFMANVTFPLAQEIEQMYVALTFQHVGVSLNGWQKASSTVGGNWCNIPLIFKANSVTLRTLPWGMRSSCI